MSIPYTCSIAGLFTVAHLLNWPNKIHPSEGMESIRPPQPLQKSPGSKICSFQEVFVGDSCQQPKVVLHRSELCLCYLRALANPQAASFTELNILHLRTTSSRASGQIGSSIVWTTITSMWHAFHQPWTHWLALQSHAKLVNIQVTRQGLSFTGAIQHRNWLSSNGSTNVEQLVLTTLAPQQVSSARCGHRFYLSKAGIWQQLPQQYHGLNCDPSAWGFKRLRAPANAEELLSQQDLELLSCPTCLYKFFHFIKNSVRL